MQWRSPAARVATRPPPSAPPVPRTDLRYRRSGDPPDARAPVNGTTAKENRGVRGALRHVPRSGAPASRHWAGSAAESFRAPLDRVLTLGLAVALTGVALQTLVHLLNAAFFENPLLDANAEHNPMTWASTVATFAAALAAALHATLLRKRRRTYIVLACAFAFFSLDDAILLHERLATSVLDALGVSVSWDSVLWPALYLPLAGVVVLSLLAVAHTAPARAGRFIRIGLLLLLAAVAAEALSAPVSTTDTGAGWAHVLVGAFEEGAELASWILIATGLMVSTLSKVPPPPDPSPA